MLFNQIIGSRFAIFNGIKDGIDDLRAGHAFVPPVFRLNDHHWAGFTLLEAAGGDDLDVQTAVEDFLLDILEKTIGLLVADPLGIAFGTETLTNEDF